MTKSFMEEIAAGFRQTLEEDLSKPFPYDDCRRVLARAGDIADGDIADGLIPDLDLYFSDIAGYCSHGKKLLNMPKDDLVAARATLERSFFEKHPEYRALAVWINEIETPMLFAEINRHEEVRCKLLELISNLLSDSEIAETVLADKLAEPSPAYSISQS
ncbi:MAG: YxiJ family protein [Blastocatellia bacterium]